MVFTEQDEKTREPDANVSVSPDFPATGLFLFASREMSLEARGSKTAHFSKMLTVGATSL